MFGSPNGLQDLCLETICEHYSTYLVPLIKTKDGWVKVIKPEDYDDEVEKRYTFRDPDIFLINEISENIFKKLHERRLLCDATLNIFTERNTKLRKVKIKNCKVTKKGLRILKEHKLVDLECVHLKNVNIVDVLDCLNEWTKDNLTNANFSQCTFIDEKHRCLMINITALKNLRSLNLSYTELNQVIFKIICEDLKYLEKLDISGTQVNDLSPLKMLSLKLVNLSICDLWQAQNIVSTLKRLRRLRYLDVSLFKDRSENSSSSTLILDILECNNIFPDLVLLDISGWRDFDSSATLVRFIDTHPKLKFLGIVECCVIYIHNYMDRGDTNIVIAGFGNEEQIKVTLVKYIERPVYLNRALLHLFQLTISYTEAKPDIFDLVLFVMESHSNLFHVQMAATACIYNLTRGDLSKEIHTTPLSKAVKLTLFAMETFPEEFQLQKNALLMLCSDRILQDVSFDKFRCAKLVLDALCHFDDATTNRMAVAICSILAAKVTTEQTSELGTKPAYMSKLLQMVKTRVDSDTSDITLKFTLSALWNLTDECSATCSVFLELDGAQLFLKVLVNFKNDHGIETKVLGLLNNIAEVTTLRDNLMFELLMEELFRLLKSENIDVSYFAAGIVAHLASDGEESWKLTNYSRTEMLTELKNAVSQWKVPENEMVAYRSFRPFFSLLRLKMDYEVQLWAVWAIHHVCTKNPKRYCQMLLKESGNLLLADLKNYHDTHPEIKHICGQILDTLVEKPS